MQSDPKVLILFTFSGTSFFTFRKCNDRSGLRYGRVLCFPCNADYAVHTYTCDYGYTMIGSNELFCYYRGESLYRWSDRPPSCQRKLLFVKQNKVVVAYISSYHEKESNALYELA